MPDRLSRARAALDRAGLDGLLISSPREEHLGAANRRYLTGFSGSTGVVLVTADTAAIAVDFRYVEQAQRECTPRGISLFETSGPGAAWFPAFLARANLAGKRLGIAADDLTYAGYLSVATMVEAMPPADRPELTPAHGVVEGLRRIKDAEELALLQRAIDIGDQSFERMRAGLQPGTTEERIAIDLEAAYRDLGADGPSFPSIVAGGPWSAMPHASPRPEPVAAGVPIVVDMGSRYRAYCSDLTRSFTLGQPDAKFREIYGIVFEAQRAAIEGVEPGMSGAQAHALALDVIAHHGYGDRFGHGLGHGVGLEVHEDPYLGPTSDDTLEEGMVFTIEPGIYIPGWGGVRIEDVVVLEGGRARVLSHATKLVPAGV